MSVIRSMSPRVLLLYSIVTVNNQIIAKKNIMLNCTFICFRNHWNVMRIGCIMVMI
jgi:hypothetical protein